MFKTFKFRLLASYLCVVFFSLGLVSFLLDRALEQEARKNLNSFPAGQASSMENRVALAASSSGGKKYFPDLTRIRRVILFSSALSAGFAVLLGLWLIAMLSKPLADIIGASKRFAAGDLDHRLHPRGSGELKKLAQTFNSMAEDLSRKIGELSARKQEIEAVFNNMSEGIILTDGAGVIKTLNAAAEKLTGVPAAQAAGRRVADVFGGNGLDSAALETLRSGKPVSRELSAAFKERVDFQVQTVAVREGGLVKGCVLVAHDVSS